MMFAHTHRLSIIINFMLDFLLIRASINYSNKETFYHANNIIKFPREPQIGQNAACVCVCVCMKDRGCGR